MVSVATRIYSGLARRAPRLADRVAVRSWRRRNRDRANVNGSTSAALAEIVERLRREGVVITDVETLFGDPAPYEAARTKADELYRQPRERPVAEEGSKATFLTKLATGAYDVNDAFAAVALHPNVLAVANGYLRLRSTLRVIDLWLTQPTPGPAIQTQLWHRDADDVVNVKMFVYFTDVARGAGPLCYAPRTHPLGSRRSVPDHDEQWRSTDEQLAAIVPDREWIYCEGGPGTVVFADTCGYHKQAKPTHDERLLLVCQYVSGTPFVERAVELTGVEGSELTDDQYTAVFDRVRGS